MRGHCGVPKHKAGSRGERVENYFRYVLEQLHAGFYTVTYDPKPMRDLDVHAQVQIHTQRINNQHVILRLGRHYFDFELEYQRYTMTHEGFHVVLNPLTELYMLSSLRPAEKLMLEAKEEEVVDRLARIYAPQLKFPRF